MYASRKLRLIEHQSFPLNAFLAGNCYAIEEIVNPGYRYRISDTGYLALILTRSGVSDYLVDGIPRRIEADSFFILPPGISFSEHVPGPEPIHNIYLMLEGPLARKMAADLPFEEPFLYREAVPTALGSALEDLVHGIHAEPTQKPFEVAGELCRLAHLLQETMHPSRSGQWMADQLERYVGAEPSAHWNVARMARAFAMSESSFAHTFRREAGLSPAAFVRRFRCRLAQSLLEEGKSVAETAELLGFPNPFHFTRVFKAETGMPPSRIKGRSRLLHRA